MSLLRKLQAVIWPAHSSWNEFVSNFSFLVEAAGFEVRNGNLVGIRSIFRNSTEVCIIHWIDPIFSNQHSLPRVIGLMARLFVNVLFLKISGAKLIWVVHNIAPHDIKRSHQFLYKASIRYLSLFLNGWMTLAPSTKEIVVKEYGFLASIPSSYIWHPRYKNHSNLSKSQAREILSLPRKGAVFGHVGALRSYKNLITTADVFREIQTDKRYLFFTGFLFGDNAVRSWLDSAESKIANFKVIEKKLSREEVDTSLTSLDVFLAPYHNFLHSGAIIHALCRGCVVIAPRAPFTSDLQEQLGGEWLILFEEAVSNSHFVEAENMAQKLIGKVPDMSFASTEKNLPLFRSFLLEAGVVLEPSEYVKAEISK